MITHKLIQCTPAWHAFRANHYTASDAAAMLGLSPYKTRSELLKEKATGIVADVDEFTQRLFAKGHHFERLTRPLAEDMVGEELYPIIGSHEKFLNGKLAASFDGLTLLGDVNFEHKMLNSEIESCATVRPYDSVNDLPIHYKTQMEQQMLVSGAHKSLFVASDWDEHDRQKNLIHFWYYSNLELQRKIIAGWEQFDIDRQNYRYKEEKIVVAGVAPQRLPALRIEVVGQVTDSNLTEFKSYALQIFNGIKTVLITDEDFANADSTAKWCKQVQERLEAAKQHALSQTESIDELFRTIDQISKCAKEKETLLKKLVTQQKEKIRVEKIQSIKNEFYAYLSNLKNENPDINLNATCPDFASVLRNLKTLRTIDNALATALAAEKVALQTQLQTLKIKKLEEDLAREQELKIKKLEEEAELLRAKKGEQTQDLLAPTFTNLPVKTPYEYIEGTCQRDKEVLLYPMPENYCDSRPDQQKSWLTVTFLKKYCPQKNSHLKKYCPQKNSHATVIIDCFMNENNFGEHANIVKEALLKFHYFLNSLENNEVHS